MRVWQVDAAQGRANALAMTDSSSPVLDATWAQDARSIYISGVDNYVHRWDLQTNTKNAVAAHDAPVKHAFEVPDINALATASWDKTLKYWDVRAPTGQSMANVQLPERVYAMDTRGPLMVLGLAERKLVVFDVRKPTTPFQDKYSQLRYQTRCLATWPDSMGYAVGSVEGKVSMDYVQERKNNQNYVFVCHRDKQGGVYAINSIRFHEQSGAFVTAGSDGYLHFWDKDRRDHAPMRKFQQMEAPIIDVDFSADGGLFAYAVGYDWGAGAVGNKGQPSYIVLHQVEDGELHLAKNNGYRDSGKNNRGRGGRRRGNNRR